VARRGAAGVAAPGRGQFQSGAALATVVGVLVEVPVMLSVVRIVNRSKGWYESGAAVACVTEAKRAS
jgi:ACR3 family arsenite transporter